MRGDRDSGGGRYPRDAGDGHRIAALTAEDVHHIVGLHHVHLVGCADGAPGWIVDGAANGQRGGVVNVDGAGHRHDDVLDTGGG